MARPSIVAATAAGLGAAGRLVALLFLLASVASAAATASAADARLTNDLPDANPLAGLDPALEWQIGAVELEGEHALGERELRRLIETTPRKRFFFWRPRPVFDEIVFERDLERITRLYETEGYYRTRIVWRVESKRTAKAEILTIHVGVDEGPRARVTAIEILPPDPELMSKSPAAEGATTSVTLDGSPSAAPGTPAAPAGATKRRWALAVGDPFRELDYQRLEVQLRAAYLDRGNASVEIRRSARVRPDREGVALRYEITPGPPARFGAISIEGLDKVDRRIVERELTIEPDGRFALSRIEESRRRLQQLDLFSSIELDWQPDPAKPEVAPVRVALREKKSRELRIGAGYSTEERARAYIRWQNRNWLGGGRRLLMAGRYSNLVRSAEVSFAQPHLFGSRLNRGLFDFGLFQQDEPNFTRNSIEGVPAFERTLRPKLTGNLGFRIDAAEIRDVEDQVRDAIGGVRNEGTVIGPHFNLRWTPVDDVAKPTNGLVASIDAQYSTRHIGATFDYLRVTGEVSVFKPIFDYAVVAGRLKLGAAEAFGDIERLPIFERFYAGGEGSVRGYRRHQLGPTAKNGNPLGGRSLIEGSIETRMPVYKNFGAVAFLDFGQVSLDYDYLPSNLRFAAGPGISYSTPIGPISLFAGFPINRQRGEPPWQMHFNIGFFF